MADKVPIKATFDAASEADGLAEFVSGDTLGYAHGGTGLAALGSALQYLRTNAAANSMEWGTVAGDIEAVIAGDGLSGGGTSGSPTIDLDLNELTAAVVNVANDSIAIIDADDSNDNKKESIADLVSGITGTNLTATSGVIALDIDAEVDFNDQTAKEIVLKDYSETDVAVTSSSGVISVDLANGNTGSITLTENITDIDLTNVPTSGVSTFTLQITQDSTDRTVAINAVTVNGGGDVTALTAGGAGFTMSTGSGAIDLVTFLFLDAGTPLLNALQDFS